MNKTKTLLSAIVVSVLAVLGAVLLPSSSAFADESSVDYRLSITPTQKSFGTIKPGETYSDKFKVKNTGREPFDFSISFAPYNVEGKEYTANYDKATKYNDIADWLSVDIEHGTVAAGDETEITYSFTVPEGTHGGAQLGTIMITMNDSNDKTDGGVETVRRLGYLVFGNVDGEITTTAKILENKIPSFIFTPPFPPPHSSRTPAMSIPPLPTRSRFFRSSVMKKSTLTKKNPTKTLSSRRPSASIPPPGKARRPSASSASAKPSKSSMKSRPSRSSSSSARSGFSSSLP